MFRLMDPVSRRMMGVRSDTTMQISRVVASRLSDEPRPLRLCYDADILRVSASKTRPERQFKQVGAEYIGANTEKFYPEILVMAVQALSDLGVPSLNFDFTAPEIPHLLIGSNQEAPLLLEMLQKRDQSALKKMGKTGQQLSMLLDLTGTKKQVQAKIENKLYIQKLASAKIIQSIKKTLKFMEEVEKTLEEFDLKDAVRLTFDPCETQGFSYQSGPSFTVFSAQSRSELGRGGSYDCQFQLAPDHLHSEPAFGMTFYMDAILRLLPKDSSIKRLAVSAKETWSAVRTLQAQGYEIVRLPYAEVDETLAHSYQCFGYLKQNKILTVKNRK
jgi:ATP phosphoribosyltransferase regulatory subunit